MRRILGTFRHRWKSGLWFGSPLFLMSLLCTSVEVGQAAKSKPILPTEGKTVSCAWVVEAYFYIFCLFCRLTLFATIPPSVYCFEKNALILIVCASAQLSLELHLGWNEIISINRTCIISPLCQIERLSQGCYFWSCSPQEGTFSALMGFCYCWSPSVWQSASRVENCLESKLKYNKSLTICCSTFQCGVYFERGGV